MYRDDSNQERIAQLIEMFKTINTDPDPVRSISHYAGRMRQLYGEQGLISVSLRNVPPGHYRVMRFLNQKSSGIDGSHDIVFAGPDAPAVKGGIIGDLVQNEFPVVIRELSIPDDPVLGNRLAPYRMLVAVPVYDGDAALNWVIFLTVDPEGFTPFDIETRILQSNLMSGITNIKRTNQELVLATEWIHREVDEIALIQKDLLPGSMPHIPGLRLAASYRYFDRAGGDLYDVFPMGERPEDASAASGTWGILIADVSGHGVASAVIVAMLSTLVAALAERTTDPGELLTRLNRFIAAKAINGNFVTAFLMTYDTANGSAAYACAGHNVPLRRSTDGVVNPLPGTGGIPLGITGAARYETVPLDYRRGDTVLLYTDGVTESHAPSNDLFGEARLEAVLAEAPGDPEEVIRAVSRALEQHQAGSTQSDDQALLAITFDGVPGLD
ncbi:MAG: hypothetical protein AMXMBFR82_49410 [Candidatus Hydrogenedentota bacterium]